jgi:hypothetical protein
MRDINIKMSTVCIKGGLLVSALCAFFLLGNVLTGIPLIHPLIATMLAVNGIGFAVMGWAMKNRKTIDE